MRAWLIAQRWDRNAEGRNLHELRAILADRGLPAERREAIEARIKRNLSGLTGSLQSRG